MKRKTYGNVLKAGKLIQKKGYGEKEALEMAVQCFDNLAEMNNGMSVEWLIEKIADKVKEQEELKTELRERGYDNEYRSARSN